MPLEPMRNVITCGRRVRVFALPKRYMTDFFLGRARIKNMPSDAEVLNVHKVDKQVGLLVYSAQYSPVMEGAPAPVVTAMVERVA